MNRAYFPLPSVQGSNFHINYPHSPEYSSPVTAAGALLVNATSGSDRTFALRHNFYNFAAEEKDTSVLF